MSQNAIHAIVREEDGLLAARVVELNIAVCADSEPHLLEEIAHAIQSHYGWAIQEGLTPFADIYRQPSDTSAAGIGHRELGEIKLPKEVAMALAIAIHAKRPTALHLIRMAA